MYSDMADDRFIDIRVEGEDKIFDALRLHEYRSGTAARDFVDDLSTFARNILVTSVPRGRSSYILRHVGRTPAIYRPGGVGGGGVWEAVAGIKAGDSYHPLYVEVGTGVHYGTGFIYPRGRVFRIEKPFPEADDRGRVTKYRHPRWVTGQEGQHYFYKTWQDVLMLAGTRIIRRNLGGF